eukprot:3932092-Rhodomonas_salina.1
MNRALVRAQVSTSCEDLSCELPVVSTTLDVQFLELHALATGFKCYTDDKLSKTAAVPARVAPLTEAMLVWFGVRQQRGSKSSLKMRTTSSRRTMKKTKTRTRTRTRTTTKRRRRKSSLISGRDKRTAASDTPESGFKSCLVASEATNDFLVFLRAGGCILRLRLNFPPRWRISRGFKQWRYVRRGPAEAQAGVMVDLHRLRCDMRRKGLQPGASHLLFERVWPRPDPPAPQSQSQVKGGTGV